LILVTGGAGYIGGVTAEKLLHLGEDVVIYDNLSRGHSDAVPAAATFVEGEIGDREKLRETFRHYPISGILHFAAFALVGESMTDPALYFRNNLSAALTLLDESQTAAVERFIFSSTCAIFGDQNPSPIGETAPKSPINPYGESKLAFERALHWHHEIHGMAYFALRYFNACGATAERGERHEPETHLIPLVLEAAAGERDAIQILGDDYPTPDGTCIRDYIHVEDLADAHIAALKADAQLSGCYNLGTGRGHSVREVIDTARRVTEREIPTQVAPRRPGDPPELVADPGLVREKLGWTHRHDLESAIRSAWQFKQRAPRREA
jgi:UDP-glucose 4-epimerase